MPFTEDRTAFLSASEFAVAATYNGVTAVTVIFDEPYSTQGDVGSSNPTALGNAADFPVGTSIGKTLLISGTQYTIRHREPVEDGAFVLLELEA